MELFLRRVSDPIAAKAAIRVQALRYADEALAELSEWLAAHPMSDAALETMMERPATQAFGPRRWPLVSVHHY